MSKKSLAKGHDELLAELIDKYAESHGGGGFRMEDVTEWILAEGLLPLPKIDPRRLLTRKLKQAARKRKLTDAQGRTVRQMIAAKIERISAEGKNLILDVVWDFLHTMSVDHALIAFTQRDEIIEKHRLSATREVHSFLDNNLNARGHESQFEFKFMLESPSEQVQESLAESPAVQPRDQPIPKVRKKKKKPR
jgi:hypothetical protein